MRQPLIDAWVKSGTDSEFRGALFLLGGRPYPLRLEFSKAKQGVDDSDKQKEKPVVSASIALEWKPPGQSKQTVPSRYLFASRVSESMVVTTPFPPDDRSVGYERGTSVSKEWEVATTDAAIEVAVYVASRLRELAGTPDDGSDREQRLREFCVRFAERAFRTSMDAELREFIVDRRFQAAPDLDTAVRRVILLVLKSPRFLYRELTSRSLPALVANPPTDQRIEASQGSLDSFDVASRLAFCLWDSLPDDVLLQAAAAGELSNEEQVRRQAERMLADFRTRVKLRAFLLQWLKVDPAPDLAKDPKRFPDFGPEVAADLRESLDLFLDRVVWGEGSDFREFLSADGLFLNGRLANLYGADLPPDAPFQWVVVGAEERAGVLTHPYLMATFAYTASSSPIHRGVFVARSVLGRPLKPPPEAFTPLPAELHPNLSTRERVMLQTKPDACIKCHGMINPLGFALESFDAIGRFRQNEDGRPIDTTGEYQSRSGESVTFPDVRGLADFLAGSDEVHATFVEQLFQVMVKQPVRAYGSQVLDELRQSFQKTQFSVTNLLVRIAVLTAMDVREPPLQISSNP
jgi:hypothetical protein